MIRRTAEQTRELVLEVASELFYWHGIRATGVDQLAVEAAIAPTTLYRLFSSKDDLVRAYVARAHRLYREWFDAAAQGASPRARILGVFAALDEQVLPHQCRGCPFLMALAEFPDTSHPAHIEAVKMKSWVRSQLSELAADVGRASPGVDPEELADHLVLLMEGVYASVQALGHHGPARRARAVVAGLLTTAENGMNG